MDIQVRDGAMVNRGPSISAVCAMPQSVYLNSNPNAYQQSFKNSKAGNVCAIIGLSLSVLYIIFFIILISTNAGIDFLRNV